MAIFTGFPATYIGRLTEMIKKSKPTATIVWGGPEVSYDAQSILRSNPYVDYLYSGEGEVHFPAFVWAWDEENMEELHQIPGIASRLNQSDTLEIVPDLSVFPFAYKDEDIRDLTGRIIYYESMRGCPFNCSYCLSSTLKRVRYHDLKRVFSELDYFIAHNVRQVKFVDRTFNVDRQRATAILNHLAAASCTTNFHFELSADLMDDAMFEAIAKAPVGRFQFEIGIQSTYYHTFSRSFNETMALAPQMLQLGFLKLLKGTRIRREAAQYGFVYQSFAPYEVIGNDFISPGELCQLHGIEDLVDRYYNGGICTQLLHYIFEEGTMGEPFAFFEAFSKWWRLKGYHHASQSQNNLYRYLWSYLMEARGQGLWCELLIFDYFSQSNRQGLPEFTTQAPGSQEAFKALSDETWMRGPFEKLLALTPKNRLKRVVFQRFSKALAQYFNQGSGLVVFYEGHWMFLEDDVEG